MFELIKCRNLAFVAAAIVAVVLVGCGTEVGRIPFNAAGAGETEVQADAGKNIDFWTDLKIEFTGEIGMAYFIELYQDGELTREVTCSPLDVSTIVKSVETRIGDHHSIKYNGKMRCSVSVPSSGQTLVKAKLLVDAKSGSLTLERADLVVKQ